MQGLTAACGLALARRHANAKPQAAKSGRQESNLPRTAYQTVASPPGPRPAGLLRAPCTGVEPVSPARQAGRHTRCVTGRKECPAGVAPACPPWQGGAWAARPRTPKARTEGVEPSTCGLEPHCSPRSTSLTGVRNQGSGVSRASNRLLLTPDSWHKLRGLESSQHLWVQSPPSCR